MYYIIKTNLKSDFLIKCKSSKLNSHDSFRLHTKYLFEEFTVQFSIPDISFNLASFVNINPIWFLLTLRTKHMKYLTFVNTNIIKPYLWPNG